MIRPLSHEVHSRSLAKAGAELQLRGSSLMVGRPRAS
jgi:hypothetical protein